MFDRLLTVVWRKWREKRRREAEERRVIEEWYESEARYMNHYREAIEILKYLEPFAELEGRVRLFRARQWLTKLVESHACIPRLYL